MQALFGDKPYGTSTSELDAKRLLKLKKCSFFLTDGTVFSCALFDALSAKEHAANAPPPRNIGDIANIWKICSTPLNAETVGMNWAARPLACANSLGVALSYFALKESSTMLRPHPSSDF